MNTIQRLRAENVPQIAWIHIQAFPDSALTRLGPRVVQRYYLETLTGPYVSVATGYFIEGICAGYCIGGVFKGLIKRFVKKNFLLLALSIIVHPSILFTPKLMNKVTVARKAFRSKNKQAQRAEDRHYGVLALATDLDVRGFGIGKSLIAAHEQIALASGYTKMRLTVDPDNTLATEFYLSQGWTPVHSSSGKWKGKMEKQLEAGVQG